METSLVPLSRLPASVEALRSDLLAAVLAGRSAHTLRAYAGDFADFAKFVQSPSAAIALDQLVSLDHGLANATALAYRANMVDRHLAPSTIARRLTALRSACRIARLIGRISWSLEVDAPRAEAYRDTSGPGRDGWLALLDLAKQRASAPSGRRDLAILRLLHDLALRREEVSRLDLVDVDLQRSTVQVLGKGKRQKAPLTLAAPTRSAIADWIAVRGIEPGPLVFRMDRARTGILTRLSGESIRRLVARLGSAAGLSRTPRPHGLRHQGITRALDVSNGNVRAVQRFSRHASADTVSRYDDNRSDLAGEIAVLVADE